jgi:3-phenylpropionate/cinnamic acid dioxygenase small subunit
MLAKTPARPSIGSVEQHHAVTALNNDAACFLDNELFDDWIALFVEEASYRLMPRDNYLLGLPISIIHCESKGMIEDRIFAARESTMAEPRIFRHMVSNVRITEINGDELSAEANVLVTETLINRMTQILVSGVYLDKIVKRDGRLMFKERLCV